MSIQQLKTKRLSLVPCSLAMLQSLLKGDFESKFGLKLAENWPSGDVLDALPIFAEWLKLGKADLGWGLWLIYEIKKNIVVGGVGFVGNPDNDGIVELGYSIASEYQRLGYAYEASRELILWAFAHEAVNGVVARCKVENEASCALLQKLAFSKNKPKHGEILWELFPI